MANFIKLYFSVIYTALGILPKVKTGYATKAINHPEKSFMKLTPRVNVMKLFSFIADYNA